MAGVEARPANIISHAAILMKELDEALRQSDRPETITYFVGFRHKVLTINGEADYIGAAVIDCPQRVTNAATYQALLAEVARMRQLTSADVVITAITHLDGPQ